jgi:hypothetical protein
MIPAAPPVRAAGPPTFNLVKGQEAAPVGATAIAEPQRVGPNAVIRIVPVVGDDNTGHLKRLTFVIGTDQIYDGECDVANSCRFVGTNNSYLIDLGQFDTEHNEVITIVAGTDANHIGRSYLQIQQPWSFAGVTSPVLLRASGKASGFSLENLAPSLAAGVRRNFDVRRFPYVAANALVTVYSLPEDEYALSLGGVLDLSGYLQVGPTYHLEEKEWFLVLGVRPEVLFGLIPRLRPD